MTPAPRSPRRAAPPRALALAAAVAFAAGCGGGDRAPTVPVEGKVVHRDGRPLTSGFVFLVPASGGGPEASGQILPDGKFRPESLGLDGAAPGDYRVRLAPEPPAPTKGTRGWKAAAPPLDPKYLDETTSGLAATVPPEGGSITIEID
ncbi:hypothetical protein OJF2_64050 [Aquisphaera giovannonii]|uniref:Carboxypeptidase regulatory-like domain-containing protein n=1 Tax=Aquisphaera giovannonii TaxID=406548 RepID=A0A5B9WC15_9BACT|nr:hypothetical protein [Aquisphaera giovannonii]QEH37814.1 hypothetical protein OJF2_64050 [Aquisphaera giovannonii]